MTHKIKTEWQKEMQFISSATGGDIKLDAAEEFGGKNNGNRPKPLMLVALSGCTGMDVESLINKMHLEVDDFSIEVTGKLSDEHPKYYKSTRIIYNFTGKNLNEEKLTKAVDLSFDKYCGVIEMFKQFSTVTKEINFINN